jgi:hypothetical protein
MTSPVVGRRNWVLLDSRAGTRCVVVSADGQVADRLGAYALTCVRKRELLRCNDRFAGGPLPHNEMTAKRVENLLSGSCCYAFYAKPTHAVKIGRAADVLRRWSEIEHGSGMPIQLLMVWKTDSNKSFEKTLHERFAAHRGIGEWFSADEVLPALIADARTALTLKPRK